MPARNAEFTELIRKRISQLEELGWYHSIELKDSQVIQGLQSLDQLRHRLAQFPVPEDLTGKRVLDIGAWDGWFTFEMERRGAQVVAVDSHKHKNFDIAKELLGSKAEHHVADICKLTPAEIGTFDIVLFFGVLYHTKHPLLALENVCNLATDMAFIESHVSDNGEDPNAPPVMEFYETTELGGQFDNWVGPNTSCLLAFCRTAGFARTKLESVIQNRAHVTCHRRWATHVPTTPAPFLVGVSPGADDYLSIWFRSEQQDLNCDNVFPQIGTYGSRPVHVSQTETNGWHVNCKAFPGQTEVSLHVRDSAQSNKVGQAFSLPQLIKPKIHSITDGKTWELSRIHSGCISIWAEGLNDDAVKVSLNGVHIPATFISCPDSEGLRQVNAILPASLQPGEANVSLILGELESNPVTVEILPYEPRPSGSRFYRLRGPF
jgi:tRNA (mo5U34)-methyltransferase